MSIIDHDASAQRFTTETAGYRSVLDYRLNGRIMTIIHTGVPQPVAGRGIAAQLMKAALQAAKNSGWEVDPACSYAAAYLRRHPENEAKKHEDELRDAALKE